MTKSTILLLLVSAALWGGATPAAGEKRPSDAEIGKVQVYLTPDQALHEIFDGVAFVDTVCAVLTPEELESLKANLGTSMPSDSVDVLRVSGAEGDVLGYAMIAEEVGKYRPITFMVGLTPELMVRNVEVLVYRESRGGDVRRDRFLRQYRGKRPGHPVRTNRDIINIAGATLSVNALNHGVRRVLGTLETLRRREVL